MSFELKTLSIQRRKNERNMYETKVTLLSTENSPSQRKKFWFTINIFLTQYIFLSFSLLSLITEIWSEI